MISKPIAALLATATLLPLPALADDCAHVRNIDMSLDLSGVETVIFEVGPHDLRVTGAADGDGHLVGRACASQAVHLARLEVTQSRTGDRLSVRLQRKDLEDGFIDGIQSLGDFVFGGDHAALDLVVALPEGMDVRMDLGSGDAAVTGVASLEANVGSGDLAASRVAGTVRLSVGSGDVQLEDIGALDVDSIGSGDVSAARVRAGTSIGSIGSGDFGLYGAGGNVEVGSVGSGDAGLRNVKGNVRVGSVGSGDIEAIGVRGDFVVRSIGSGNIDHRDIGGDVDLPADH